MSKRTSAPSGHRGQGTVLYDRGGRQKCEDSAKMKQINDGLTMITLIGKADPSNWDFKSLLVFNQGSFTLHELYGRQYR